ncbi:putative transporter AmpG 2 [Holospora elegans E1]|uniref:Putative transporter AmpG 2 n=1 Tax=Holospora elegans E1 TaxID=1427503 RepID=A0A023E054_9PROT|nr:hypothetical protein [Holospora elegans]GAJ46795.1 putative transporter AmpG 2 [Holospora elegans E1]
MKFKNIQSRKIQGLFVIGFLGLWGGLLNKVVRTWPRLWGNDLGLSVRTFDILAVLGICYSLKMFCGPFFSLALPSWIPFSPRRFWLSMHLIAFSILLTIISFCSMFSGIAFFVCTALLFMLDGNYSMMVIACQKDTGFENLRGLPESFCLNGYRAGMTLAVSGALFFSQCSWSWPMLYHYLAGGCLVVALSVLFFPMFSSLDLAPIQPFKGIGYNFFSPIKELLKHPQIRKIFLILMLYRVADHLWTPNQELFFLHMGFSKQQYSVQDFWNFWGSSFGIFVSGYCIQKFSVLRVMRWGMTGQLLVFAGLFWGSFGNSLGMLSCLCIFQRILLNFSLTSVFAFQIMTVNLGQAITQLSIFTALAHFNSQLVSSCSGWLIVHVGWSGMIFASMLACVPALIYMFCVSKDKNFL